MEKFLTIFTPTYNRAYILPKLYESLKNQAYKNFVWLIVDDGSSDETKTLVQRFQRENNIEIRYIHQENKGKHFAVNQGLRNTKTDFFCVIDSDDHLAENAVEEMKELSGKVINNPGIAGFAFIRLSEKEKIDHRSFGQKEWLSGDSDYDWKVPGEMMYCCKTKVHQQFYFPEFGGEKFCPESLVYRRIERKYKILVTDKVLAFGDYLEDGLTSSYYQLLLKNPRSSLLNIRERFRDNLSEEEKMSLARIYWDIASKTDQSFTTKFFGINPFLILKMLINKRIR
ncbi:glycosyltransferase family A protein [Epilithonimonas mollis]|uniref:Glycosyl transferase family 2 n=1 Tax=Epilithonimonas mollis TaxID=216903 RepID=A0A1M6R8G9_9FLAO|nr:glycosyltransferase family A protein [Epilithonimonas mollis]SHK28752.1 Glycosyl transferase family 2 [Epilithonimonas mollis]